MPKVSKAGKFRKKAASERKVSPLLASALAASKKSAPSLTDAASVDSTSSGKPKPQHEQQRDATTTKASTAPLSRGQRRRMAKREQYMKKERMILSSLKLEREEEQKKRIDGLDAIREALLGSVVADNKKKKIGTSALTSGSGGKTPQHDNNNMLKTNKSRQKLVQKEVAQMNLVLQHPAFQADPLATIREHLQNTLASDYAAQKEAAAAHVVERKQKQEERNELKKEQGVKGHRKKKFKATRSKKR